MLKITEVQLQLLIDPDMLLMFEKFIKGGISTISHRYGEAIWGINAMKQNGVNTWCIKMQIIYVGGQ